MVTLQCVLNRSPIHIPFVNLLIFSLSNVESFLSILFFSSAPGGLPIQAVDIHTPLSSPPAHVNLTHHGGGLKSTEICDSLSRNLSDAIGLFSVIDLPWFRINGRLFKVMRWKRFAFKIKAWDVVSHMLYSFPSALLYSSISASLIVGIISCIFSLASSPS